MKIVVALKQVPARDSVLKPDPSGRSIETADLTYEINEPDAYALEAALQLKERSGGEVIALCAGPASAATQIREALAKGADRAIHIEEENLAQYDTLSLGQLLAAAIRTEAPSLVLTGLQSDDLGYGQTGVIIAELLGFAHATIIMQVELAEGGLRAKRELENGWFQWIHLPTPAVLTIQSGLNKLRYATLMGIKKAKTKEVRRSMATGLGVSAAQGFTLEKLYAPERARQITMIEGNAHEQAARLAQILKREVRVI